MSSTMRCQITLGIILTTLACDNPQTRTMNNEAGGTQIINNGAGGTQTINNGIGGTQTMNNGTGGIQTINNGTGGTQTLDSGTGGIQIVDNKTGGTQIVNNGTGGAHITDSGTIKETGGNPTKDGGTGGTGGTSQINDGNLPDIIDAPKACPDNFPRGNISSLKLVSKFTPSPEGVTVCPGGDVFISIPGSNSSEIKRIAPGTEAEHWTTIQGSQTDGITCDYKKRLFIGQYGGTPTPMAIIMVTGKDDPGTRLPSPQGTDLSLINGVIAITGRGVYASDTTNNLIVRTDDSKGSFETTVVANDISQPNGLSYNPVNKTLYVGMSLNNTIGAFEVKEDGSLGVLKTVWTGPDLVGFVDGTAVDETGTLYAANWLNGKVVRTSDNKVLTDILANPASLAWRGGMLFITDFKLTPEEEGGLYAMNLGVCGPTLW